MFTNLNRITVYCKLFKRKTIQEFFTSLVISLVTSKHVQYRSLALHLKGKVKLSSRIRRVERFMCLAEFDYDHLFRNRSYFLPLGKVDLCMDRTEWDFGELQVNLLVITAYCQGTGIPICFETLDNNSGNSSPKDRKQLLEKAISILGKERIRSIIGDREFIGEKWIDSTMKAEITYYFRIPNNRIVTLSNGRKFKVSELLGDRKKAFLDNVFICGKWQSLALGRKKKNGKEEIVSVITNGYARSALTSYKLRWSIEVFFQSCKNRAFRLEETHVMSHERLKKLFTIVCFAYSSCLRLGMYLDKKIEKG